MLHTVTELPLVDELRQVASSSHMVCSQLKSEVVDGDMDMDEDIAFPEMAINPSNFCRQFISEQKKKFQV